MRLFKALMANEKTTTEREKEPELKDAVKIVLSDEQRYIIQRALQGISLFITGKAGTGKSTLLLELIQQLITMYGEDHVFVTSSTGISACNIGGTTLHSYAGIGTGEDTVASLLKQMPFTAQQRWKTTKVLIIDEISMIRPDLFDKLELIARTVRRRKTPFGGIQLIVCGDFFQLPPVYKRGEPIKYCFEANSWNDVIQCEYELHEVHRQNDARFLAVLDEVRNGSLSTQSKELLSSRVKAIITTPLNGRIKPALLRSKRETALEENFAELKKLSTPGIKSIAKDWAVNDKLLMQLKENCQAPEILYIREGAQVMLLRNLNLNTRLCNGALGIITNFVNDMPEVTFPTTTTTLSRVRFEIKSGSEVIAYREQFPITLGWSVTIHKSQGMTLDYANVELSNLFASGQGYTALSRVRSLEGLAIDCVPTTDRISVDQKVVEYYEKINSTNQQACRLNPT